ncbi:MAG: cysteine dioxygenase family protein [Acidobacteriota bacterium]
MTMDRKNLSKNIRCLIEAVEACEELTPVRTRQLLEEATLSASDLAPWADYDHPRTDSYGRRMLFDGGCFELMVMSWAPGDMSAIHDHGFTQWGAVRLFGDAEHAMFKVSDGEMRTVERAVYPEGSVVAVSHDMVHQMGNRGDKPFLSLHLYGCYEREGDVTAEARLYELDRGEVCRTSGGVFFDLPESAVLRSEAGPKPDFPTWLRHQVALLRRLTRAQGDAGGRRAAAVLEELTDAATWQRGRDAFAALDGLTPDVAERRRRHFVQELRAAAELLLDLRRRGHASFDTAALEASLRSEAADFATALLEAMPQTEPVSA